MSFQKSFRIFVNLQLSLNKLVSCGGLRVSPPPDTSCSTYICFNHSYISFCRLGLPCLTIVDHSRGAYRHPLPVCRILQQQPQHNSGPCLFSTCHLFYNRVQVWATVVLKLSSKCLQKVSGYKESCRISADCSDKNVKW